MRKYGLLALAFLLMYVSPARAQLRGYFPGLDAMTERADAVVVLRVDRVADSSGLAIGVYALYDCYIYQTLKGDVAASKPIRLGLADFFKYNFNPLPEGSTWLAFLYKNPGESKDAASPSYAILPMIGAMTQVSPIGQEKKPDGETPVEKVRNVLKAAVEYRRKEYEQEQAYLQMLIEGEPDTDGSKSFPR